MAVRSHRWNGVMYCFIMITQNKYKIETCSANFLCDLNKSSMYQYIIKRWTRAATLGVRLVELCDQELRSVREKLWDADYSCHGDLVCFTPWAPLLAD